MKSETSGVFEKLSSFWNAYGRERDDDLGKGRRGVKKDRRRKKGRQEGRKLRKEGRKMAKERKKIGRKRKEGK